MTLPKKLSIGEETMALHLRANGIDFVREYVFAPGRKWRFDFALKEQMIAIEVDGGTWIGGRHSRGDGYAKDCEKLNIAAIMGWIVLRYTPEMVERGDAIRDIMGLLP